MHTPEKGKMHAAHPFLASPSEKIDVGVKKMVRLHMPEKETAEKTAVDTRKRVRFLQGIFPSPRLDKPAEDCERTGFFNSAWSMLHVPEKMVRCLQGIFPSQKPEKTGGRL